jgi:acyl transferase domain-containing protein
MNQVFGEAGATHGSIVVGSVKSNIGHIKCASGVAALIKSAKAAYHRVLPPTLHIRRPNEVWDPTTSPFVFLDQARPWLDDQRLIGVSGFGFGGTNFHAILESPDNAADPVSQTSGRAVWPSELFVFRATSGADLDARLNDLANRLADELVEPRQTDRVRLRDVAASVCAKGEGPVRLALVADSVDDLATKIAALRDGQEVPGVYRAQAADGAAAPPQVAFLFPGPESARIGMGADLLVALPALRSAAQAARRWTDVMLPPQAFGDQHARQQAALAEAAGPAVAVASLTLASALVAFDVMPDRVAGCGSPLLGGAPASELAEALHGTPSALAGMTVGSSATQDDEARFLAEVRELSAAGVEIFVEVGPGRRLTELVQRAAPTDQPLLAVAADQPGQHGLTNLLHALAQVAVAGVPVNLAALHAGRGSQPERWDDPGRRIGWIINGQCARDARGQSLPKGIRPAYETPELRLVPVGEADAAAPATVPAHGSSNGHGNGSGNGSLPPAQTQEVAVVIEYLRTIHEIIATGSDIVRSRITEGAPDR